MGGGPAHLLVLLPAFQRRHNVLVEPRGQRLRLDHLGRRGRGLEQPVVFVGGVAVLAAAARQARLRNGKK